MKAHPFVATAGPDEAVPFVNDELPPELTVGFVVGHCGHRVARSEWAAGYRLCEHCAEPR